MSRRALSPQRKKVVLLCTGVACMSSGPILLRDHKWLLGGWIVVMFGLLVYAGTQFAKLKGQER